MTIRIAILKHNFKMEHKNTYIWMERSDTITLNFSSLRTPHFFHPIAGGIALTRSHAQEA
jgi:hypothetical protein